MWESFGKKEIGYSQEDYQQAVASVIGKEYSHYFDECIEGTAPLQERLANALQYIGCELHILNQLPDSQNIEVAVRLKEGLSPAEKENLKQWSFAVS
jgi:predicted metalloprotease with PDZ domain